MYLTMYQSFFEKENTSLIVHLFHLACFMENSALDNALRRSTCAMACSSESPSRARREVHRIWLGYPGWDELLLGDISNVELGQQE